jgi:hypothetical protein
MKKIIKSDAMEFGLILMKDGLLNLANNFILSSPLQSY